MKKNIIVVIVLFSLALLGGCGENSNRQEPDYVANTGVISEEYTEAQSKSRQETLPEESMGVTESDKIVEERQETMKLPDGIYTAEFATDSSMFRINETYDGKGTLTVENGEMTIHITLGSKNIINLYSGLAEDAMKEGAELILPTDDTVTYSDGLTEEVHGFDVPIPALETEFDLALIGTKGKWYDHKVSVSNPVPLEE